MAMFQMTVYLNIKFPRDTIKCKWSIQQKYQSKSFSFTKKKLKIYKVQMTRKTRRLEVSIR